MGASCENGECVATESRSQPIMIRRPHGLGLLGPEVGGSVACGLPHVPENPTCLSALPRSPWAPGGPVLLLYSSTKLVRCGGLQRFPKEGGARHTEIKRGAGAWDPTPERQLPAKLLWALGQVGPGPGLGAATFGKEPQVLKRKAHRKCRVHRSAVPGGGCPAGACMIVMGRGPLKSWRGDGNPTLLPWECWPVSCLTTRCPRDMECVNTEHPQPGSKGSHL